MSGCRNAKSQSTFFDATGTFLIALLREMRGFAETNRDEVRSLILEGLEKWNEYESNGLSFTEVDGSLDERRGRLLVSVETMAILLQNHHDKFKVIRDKCKTKIDEINPDALAIHLATLPVMVDGQLGEPISEEICKERMKIYVKNLWRNVRSAEDAMAECLKRKAIIQEKLQKWRQEQEKMRSVPHPPGL